MQYIAIYCILFENSQAMKYQIKGNMGQLSIMIIKISGLKSDLPQSTNHSEVIRSFCAATARDVYIVRPMMNSLDLTVDSASQC